MTACDAVIANLNGARSAPSIPSADRQGVYDHAAKHLRDGGRDPAPLKSHTQIRLEAQPVAVSFAEEADRLLCSAERLQTQGLELTSTKRQKLESLSERIASLLATPDAALTEDDELAFALMLLPKT